MFEFIFSNFFNQIIYLLVFKNIYFSLNLKCLKFYNSQKEFVSFVLYFTSDEEKRSCLHMELC
jgi:hypothetical protein